MAALILSIAILLGVFVCKDKHDEEDKNHKKSEQVESVKEYQKDLFKNPKGISGY